ncbi:uncharacterized protein RHOBADRAFT_50602, partial [Rhodotorula graminis WP1]
GQLCSRHAALPPRATAQRAHLRDPRPRRRRSRPGPAAQGAAAPVPALQALRWARTAHAVAARAAARSSLPPPRPRRRPAPRGRGHHDRSRVGPERRQDTRHQGLRRQGAEPPRPVRHDAARRPPPRPRQPRRRQPHAHGLLPRAAPTRPRQDVAVPVGASSASRSPQAGDPVDPQHRPRHVPRVCPVLYVSHPPRLAPPVDPGLRQHKPPGPATAVPLPPVRLHRAARRPPARPRGPRRAQRGRLPVDGRRRVEPLDPVPQRHSPCRRRPAAGHVLPAGTAPPDRSPGLDSRWPGALVATLLAAGPSPRPRPDVAHGHAVRPGRLLHQRVREPLRHRAQAPRDRAAPVRPVGAAQGRSTRRARVCRLPARDGGGGGSAVAGSERTSLAWNDVRAL